MATSERTRKLKKLRNAFLIIDILTYVGLTFVMIIATLSKMGGGGKASTQVFSEDFMRVAVSMTTTAIIGLILVIFIKDKARTTLFIIDTILASVIWGTAGMYTVLAIWMIEEYVFHQLYILYSKKALINKEIDLRE